jgi:hypothetical protein
MNALQGFSCTDSERQLTMCISRPCQVAALLPLLSPGKELERRYREGAAVYEEDMVHRAPGAALSCGPMEAAFPWAQQLLDQEV